jgi:hypothetical protein
MTSLSDSLETLAQALKSAPEKTQLRLIDQLREVGEPGLLVLMDNLLERQSGLLNGTNSQSSPVPDLVAGAIYQVLFQADSDKAVNFLQTHFPTGVVPLRSQSGIDYLPLQRLLAEQKFQAADQLTLQKLCELAGTAAVQRKWVYFSEVEQFAIADLHTLNALWLVHSQGKFGFSVQRELWLGVGKNWEKLWSKIGWKTGNAWTRYPQEFTWDLTAPPGHLPLSNQLRGVRAFASLLAHSAWD